MSENDGIHRPACNPGCADGMHLLLGEPASERLAKILALVGQAKPILQGAPLDCTDACGDGECDCSGIRRPFAWDLDPAEVQRLATS